MKFTRHAKQRCKLYKVTTADAERIAQAGDAEGADERGNMVRTGTIADGRTIRVVIASDNPNLIITVFPRSR